MPTLRSFQTQRLLLSFFFGSASLLNRKYETFTNKLSKMQKELETEIASDDKFTTYLLLRVDSIINKFLVSVRKARSVAQVPFSSLDEFDVLYGELSNERFHRPKIPYWISKFSNSKTSSSASGDTKTSENTTTKGEPKKKKKDKDKDKDSKMVDCPAVPECIKISNKEYAEHLKNNKHKGTKPKACVKYWARG